MHQRSAGKFGPRRCFMVWNSTRQFVAMKFTWGGPVVEPPTHLFKLKQLKTGKATRGVMKALQVRRLHLGHEHSWFVRSGWVPQGLVKPRTWQEGALAHFAS